MTIEFYPPHKSLSIRSDSLEFARISSSGEVTIDWDSVEKIAYSNFYDTSSSLARIILAARNSRNAEIEQLKANAERYALLRCFDLSGYWPNNTSANPGILAFSSCSNDKFSLSNLDNLLDNMLGKANPSLEIRSEDYYNWRQERTQKAIQEASQSGNTP